MDFLGRTLITAALIIGVGTAAYKFTSPNRPTTGTYSVQSQSESFQPFTLPSDEPPISNEQLEAFADHIRASQAVTDPQEPRVAAIPVVQPLPVVPETNIDIVLASADNKSATLPAATDPTAVPDDVVSPFLIPGLLDDDANESSETQPSETQPSKTQPAETQPADTKTAPVKSNQPRAITPSIKLPTTSPQEVLPVIEAPVAKPATPDPLPTVDADPPALATRPSLAVIPFATRGFSEHEEDSGIIIADLLLTEIDTDSYRLYERSQLRAVLDEQKYREFMEAANVNNTDQASRLGREAGVEFLLLGSLDRLARDYYLNARVVDCNTGKIAVRGWVRFDSLSHARKMLPSLAEKLGLRSSPTSVAARDTVTDTHPSTPVSPFGPSHPFNGTISVHDLVDLINPSAGFKVDVQTLRSKRIYTENDRISFVVESDRDCYMTLLSVDPDGRPTLLLPNGEQRLPGPAIVQAGQPVQIPPVAASYEFIITPPHGATIVKAIATPYPLKLTGVTAKRISDEGFIALTPHAKVSVDTTVTPKGISPRRKSQPTFDGDDWTTAELMVYTRTKDEVAAARPGFETMHGVRPTKQGVLALEEDDPNNQILHRWHQLNGVVRAKGLSPRRPMPVDRNVSELLVVYDEDHPGIRTKSLDGSDGPVTKPSMRVVSFKSTSEQAINGHIKRLRAEQHVKAVVPNIKLQAFSLPSTHLFPVQWHLHNSFMPRYDISWHRHTEALKAIQPPLIGVVDTGMIINDPRLHGAVWRNAHESPNGKDSDGNGYVDDLYGYNFVNNDNRLFDRTDPFSHGSFISSIIGGRETGSRRDVVGLAPNAKIISGVALSAKPGKSDFEGELKNVLQAIEYVADQGAKVINLSLGAPVSPETFRELEALPIWDKLQAKGVIVVCAAGNFASNNDDYPIFPASLGRTRSNVISVLAVDAAGRLGRAPDGETKNWGLYTNFGRQSVHLGAPGTLLLGIPNYGEAQLLSGTSYAAAVVTAAVSLVWGAHPDWHYRTVMRAVLESTRPLTELSGRCTTGGMLDLEDALRWQPNLAYAEHGAPAVAAIRTKGIGGGSAPAMAAPLCTIGHFTQESDWNTATKQLANSTGDWSGHFRDIVSGHVLRSTRATLDRARGNDREWRDRLKQQGVRYYCDGRLENVEVFGSQTGGRRLRVTVVYRLKKQHGDTLRVIDKNWLDEEVAIPQTVTEPHITHALTQIAKQIAERASIALTREAHDQ